MTWLFFAAPYLIIVLYTEKWEEMVLPLQIMCVAGVTDTMTQVLLRVVLAQGLVEQRTRRRFIYFGALVAAIFVGIEWGIVGVAWATTIASLIHLGLILHLAIKNLPFSFIDFISAQKSSIVYVILQIGALVLFESFAGPAIGDNRVLMLICVTIVSILTFFGAHFVIRFEDLDEIVRELGKEVRKFARKLPILNRLGMFSVKD